MSGTVRALDPVTGIRDLDHQLRPCVSTPNVEVRKRRARTDSPRPRISPSTGTIVKVAGREFLGYDMSDPAASPHPISSLP